MMSKFVQYTITVSVSVEEPMEDIAWDGEDWTEEELTEYIHQERWDFLTDSVAESDWDIDVRIVERDE